MTACPWCGGPAHPDTCDVAEMMFGLGDRFSYARCQRCRSLWSTDPPDDLGRFYGGRYYSLDWDRVSAPPLRQLRGKLYLALPVKVAQRIGGRRGVPAWVPWLAGLGVRRSDRIADVGSGNGILLRSLAAFGCEDLWGFDPFISGDLDEGPIHLRKTEFVDVADSFALVMFHHSLEHLGDPVQSLMHANERLRSDGTIVVRLPIADSWAEREYGVNWVGLDAPRHMAIPSVKGMQEAATRAGLAIHRTFFDSWSLQFWGSEQYKRGIPLRDPRSVAEGGQAFSAAELAEFSKRAAVLNERGAGDTAGFVLRPKDRGSL